MENAFAQLKHLFYQLPSGIGGRIWVFIGVLFVGLFCMIWVIEKICGTRTNNYRSINFCHDLCYWIYNRSGMNYWLVVGLVAILFAVDFDKLFKPLLPISQLPVLAQVALFIVLEDFAYYWWHRAQHHFRFLWVFHAVHHSQERLTFATNGRFHPVEKLMFEPMIFILMLILGFNAAAPIVAVVFFILLSEFQHTQIPWRYGPFYRIFVSPVYHSYHHGKTAEYKDKNFAHAFALWDYLFGTAVARDISPPSSYGLVEMNPQSFVETLTEPFRLLYDDLRSIMPRREVLK